MSKIAGFFVCVVVLLSASSVFAEEEIEWVDEWGYENNSIPSPCVDHDFECLLIAGIGINTGMATHGTFYGAFRIRYLERIPLALEVNVILPYGIGANLLFYFYHDNRIAVHFIDFGIFYSWRGEMSAPWMPRNYDMTVGAGIEVMIARNLAITFDWRVFLPNPPHVIPYYADWAISAFSEAAKGGELWLGISWLF